MKVYQLARELGTTSEVILKTLKSLKLKAVDQEQELSSVVISVLKPHLTPEKRDQLEKEVASETLKKGARKRRTVKEPEQTADDDKEEEAVKVDPAPEKPLPVVEISPEKPVEKVSDKIPAKPASVIQPVYQARPPVKKTFETSPGHLSTQAVVKKSGIEPIVAARPSRTDKAGPPVKDPTKGKGKITNDPVITLKPWGKRKRKPGSSEDDSDVDRLLAAKSHKMGKIAEEAFEASQNKTFDTLRDLEIEVPISVKDLAAKLQQKPSVILMHLMKSGVMANINLTLDKDIVEKISKDFGFNVVKIRTVEERVVEVHMEEEVDPSTLKPRAPVVTFMGHVDHGKTSLLDTIRKSKVVDTEHGGITQHMRAYSVKTNRGMITFLDTPGHEAFTAMRSRGAHITDLVVLVVAADEGVMPQTEEAIDHANAANVPIIVAMNKMDKKNVNPDRVKKELMERGLTSEEWGGKTIIVPVSAHTGDGLDQLLEMILLEAEVLELKANHEKKASGIVVEAHMSQGKGAVATLIVQSGKLKEGDIIVVGPYYGKVKAMFDDRHKHIYEAGPSMPVEILGLPDVPDAGEMFYVIENERKAKEISDVRKEKLKIQRLSRQSTLTLEDLQTQIQKGDVKELRIIIKGDVQGSVEALKESLLKITSEKVRLKVLHVGVGDINASDVLLAAVSKAVIIAFHVAVDVQARKELERDPVDIREYRIIYDAVSDVKKALEGLLEKKFKKNFVGRVEVREVFKLTKGIIAGCFVQKGRITRKDQVDLVRDGQIVFSGKLSSLKRFKDDVKEVTEDMECGMTIGNFNEYQKGDIIEAYEVESISQTL